MNGAARTLRNYPQITKWLGAWLGQLKSIGDSDDYRVIVGELEEMENGVSQEEHDRNLKRLDYHLCIASTVSRNFDAVFLERRSIGSDLHEANRAILDKLAEVRAVVGLYRLGFENIEFVGTPDFAAVLNSRRFLVEVTRLGASMGKRSDVWDAESGSIESGLHVGIIVSEGKSNGALWEAIYREVEGKWRQLGQFAMQPSGRIAWISLGRDYLTAGRYELPGVGLWVKMNIPKVALDAAVQQIRDTGLYVDLSHVVLSLGRDKDDLVSPELSQGG